MHPVDRRKVAKHMYEILKSMRKVAVLLQVSPSTIYRWVHQTDRKKYIRKNTKTIAIIPVIKACIDLNPLITLNEVADKIKTVLDIKVSKELIRSVLAREGYSRKTARFYGKPADLPQKTATFLDIRNRYIQEGRVFVSVDETSFGRGSAVVKGYCKKGTPLRLARRPARITTRSVLSGACSDGRLTFTQRTGSFNKASFAQFIRSLPNDPKTVILLDNVRFHHSAETKLAAAEKGFELLYVPPYSPWFNPIEIVFSIIKRHYYQHHDVDDALLRAESRHVKAAFRHSFANNSLV